MNEPVRVGLVFPRSGQQLYVNVTRQFAATLTTLSAGLHTQGVVCLDLRNNRPNDSNDHQHRTQ